MVVTRRHAGEAHVDETKEIKNSVPRKEGEENVSAASSTSSEKKTQEAKTISVKEGSSNTKLEMMTLILLITVTIFTKPATFQPIGGPTVGHVFYYGWLTAISTGFGVVPLMLSPNLSAYWVGVSNAVAAGMMTAASVSLIWEGNGFEEPNDNAEISPFYRTLFGVALGLGFILATKGVLDQYEDLKFAGIDGSNAQKAILVFCVMTLHSFSEGVGVGVSFGGKHGAELGMFISLSLAVHNVPEGLAIAAVLVPRGTSKLSASLWAIATSLPQPLMAVPAFLFVNSFLPFVPIGLGFAGGAMLFVAIFELLVEAIEDTDLLTTSGVAIGSFATMMFIVEKIETGEW